MHARAAQGAAAKIAKEREKNEAWELFRVGCFRAGLLIVCTVAATLVYELAEARREGRLHFNWERTAAPPPSIVRRDTNPTPVKDKFFIDISSSSDALENSINGKHLEKKGWTGVCAVPLPGEFPGRKCKVLALPVGARDGDGIYVADCSRNSKGLLGLINKFFKVGCDQVPVNTVSIGKVLAIASAPKVVDYISLDTQGNATGILQSFPFSEHCVRAWSIKGVTDRGSIADIQSLLEVGQGCRISSGEGLWARCPCDKRARAAANKPTSISAIEISASGSGKHRKAATQLALDTASA